MKNLDSLDKLCAFKSVSSLIALEIVPVNDSTKIRIRHVEDFFEKVIATAKTLTNHEVAYVILENGDLRKILEIAGYSSSNKSILQQKEGIIGVTEKFEKYVERLRILEENPRRFYAERYWERRNLLRLCEDMGNYFEGKFYEETRMQSKDD
jgi:hypothetical protein